MRREWQRHPTPTWRVMAILGLACLAMGAMDAPHFRQVNGPVEIGSGEPPTWKPAQRGDPVTPGDAIRTGAGGSAELQLGSRSVRLYPNSVLRIPVADAGPHGPRAVRLEQGRSIFDVLRGQSEDRFDVRTREVVVSVKGTRFLVSVSPEDATSVSVFRGSVGVRPLTETVDREMMVRPGFSAVSAAGGILELRLSDFDDPWDAFSRGELDPAGILTRSKSHTPPATSLDKARGAAARTSAAETAVRVMRDPDTAPQPGEPTVADRVDRRAAEKLDGRAAEKLDRQHPDKPGPVPAAPDLDPVTDVMKRRLEPASGTLGAIVHAPAGSGTGSLSPAAPASPLPGGGAYSYEVVGSSLRVFGPSGLYTVLGQDQIEGFLNDKTGDSSQLMHLGSPMNQLIEEKGIDPDDVETLLETLFAP